VAVAAERLKPGDPVVLVPEARVQQVEQGGPYPGGVVFPPHDPTTGEIHDPPALPGGDDAEPPLRSAAGERLSHPPAAALAGFTDMGDIPEALDRRARVA
jgi:hypothetical protein